MAGQVATEREITASPPVVRAPRFTGRERELAELTRALAGPPAVILVEGEAGIGKTRLIQQYLATPAGRARKGLVATCPPLRRPHTLGVVTDALRRAAPAGVGGLGLSPLAGALRPLFPEWCADLPAAPDPVEDSSAVRHLVFTALAEMLARLEISLLVAEDVHWADEATLEFLLCLASQQPWPVGLVVTCRPEDVPAGSLLPRLGRLAAGVSGLRITLGPLGVAATAGLMSSMLAGGAVSEEFAGFVHAHTEGVPLAVEELVRLLAARGDVSCGEGGWVRRQVRSIGLPPAIRDAVLERAGRLTPDARAVLRAAAVLADPAGEATVAAVAGIPSPQAHAGLCEALGCGLLADDARGLVAFRHELAARAVYEAIPGPDRRAAHLHAGQVLEGCTPPRAVSLARHFREAGDTGRWARYAGRAADLALAVGDEASAAALLCDVIINAGLPPAEVVRLTDKTPLLAVAREGQYTEVARSLRALLSAGRLAPGEEAEVRFQLGRVLLVMDDNDAGQAEIKQAIRGLQPGSFRSLKAMTYLGTPYGRTCPAAEHLRWLRRAAGASGSLEPGERLALLVDRVTGLLLLGEEDGWVEAARIPGDAGTPAERQEAARCWVNTGELAMVWGQYAEARRRQARALELCERYRYVRLRGGALANEVHLDWLTGAWDGLASRAAALVGDERLHPTSRLEAVLVAGLLDAALGGRGRRTGEQVRRVLSEALRCGLVQYTAEPAAALARLALAGGDTETALKVTGEPAGIIARKGIWIWATDLGPARVQALAAAARYEEAEGFVAAFARGLHGRDAPAPRAGLALCRAILTEARGEHARAVALFTRAADAWQALPRPYEGLLARERQARCVLARGDDDTGLALLAGVQAGLSRLGATVDADRVARALREHGVAVPRVWRGGRSGYGGELSPREREVAQLAAAGHTNKEIAATLYRSPRTVGNQLKSAMRKLGVSSRVALAAHPVTADLTTEERPHRRPGSSQAAASR